MNNFETMSVTEQAHLNDRLQRYQKFNSEIISIWPELIEKLSYDSNTLIKQLNDFSFNQIPSQNIIEKCNELMRMLFLISETIEKQKFQYDAADKLISQCDSHV